MKKMPFLMGPTIDRSTFLRWSTAMVAASAVPILRGVEAAAPEGKSRFALLSDTHIAADSKEEYRGFFPARNLATVIEEVRDYPCEAAMINGDAARLKGLANDYEHLKKLLTPLAEHCPVVLGLGNHDDRDQFRKVIEPKLQPETKGSGRHVTIIDSTYVRWLVLDSLLYVDKVSGLLGKSQRTWLQEYLPKVSDKPVLIMVHHTLGDNDGDLLDSGPFLDIVKKNPHVKAIFYGHSHQYHVKSDGKLNLINLPAIGYNFSDKEPVGWMECEVHATGMKLRLHAIAGNQEKNGEESNLLWSS